MQTEAMKSENSQLPEGYKQTDVGIIPEDWNVSTVGREFEIQLGKRLDEENNVGILKPYVPNKSVQWNEINIEELPLVPLTPLDLKRLRLRQDDLLVCEGGEAGRAAIWNCPIEECYYQNTLHRLRPLRNFNSKLFLELLRSWTSRNMLANYISQTSIAHLTREKFAEVPLPVPPLPEQQAIAEVLSDVDAVITSLDQLINKKRNIKQGTLQLLLTGKKRLVAETKKGYKQTDVGVLPEDWQIEPLKEISSLKGRIGWQGLKQTEFTMNGDEPFLITGMNFKDGAIRWDEVYHISIERFEIAKEIQLKPDDVLMTKDGTIGKILFVDSIPYPHKASLNSHLLLFRPIQKSYTPKFLYYQLNSKLFKDYIELSKSGTTFFGMSQEAVSGYKVILPPIKEQKAIAQILSDMDAEIEALETKRDKYKAVKQGMMQELLTGKTRLI